jgi:hypothetical protein
VILRPIFKATAAGLTILGLMLQICLVAFKLSILVAPATGTLDSALSVICTEHGAIMLTGDATPGDRRSDCAMCPLCWHVGAGNLAVLPTPVVESILSPARAFAFELSHDLRLASFVAQPRSRGPPASA